MTDALDPEDWDEARALGHRMIDDMIDYLATVRERPAWRPMPQEARDALTEPAPQGETPLADVYEAFRDHILPYPTGNQHPGFFGWVMGNGTVTGMFADMLASGMNPHLAGYDQSASHIERQVIAWLADYLGFPADASGVLVSGGTMANLNGLAVARTEKAGYDIRKLGLQTDGAPRLTVYGGAQTHSWINKACELMGLGTDAFRATPVNDAFEVDVAACRAQIRADIDAGLKPFCLIATAGTVNTGAIDNIAALRQLADEFDLWLHVDGAFGSLAALAPEAKTVVAAQASADSIAFDLHKWGYMPYEVGCVLVRDPGAQRAAFEQQSAYLTSVGGLATDATYFSDRGLQLSRGFRALKVWMSLKEQGAQKLGRLIQRNIDQAAALAAMVRADPAFSLAAPAPLNIVCFRYAPEDVNDADLDALNKALLVAIQKSGVAVPSHTIIDGRFAIRVCITNHRTTDADLNRLMETARRLGAEIAAAS